MRSGDAELEDGGVLHRRILPGADTGLRVSGLRQRQPGQLGGDHVIGRDRDCSGPGLGAAYSSGRARLGACLVASSVAMRTRVPEGILRKEHRHLPTHPRSGLVDER